MLGNSNMFSNLLVGAIGLIVPLLILGVILFLFLRQRKGQEYDFPPLDLIDAKKLDKMVAQQVESALLPLLREKGYQEEQIKEILTRTSAADQTFRR